MLWVGGTDAAHRRTLLITAEAGVHRTEDDVEATLTEPLDGRLALIDGEHARLPMPGTIRFQSRDPSVAVATLHPSGELVVEARGVGATWVQTWAEDGTRTGTRIPSTGCSASRPSAPPRRLPRSSGR